MAMAIAEYQTCDVVECSPRTVIPEQNLHECILLVEDSEESMLLVRYAIQEYGNGTYRLEWADGLTAALKRLEKGGVDLILLDLGLPESSGEASYATIREAAPDVAVLVLTGDTRQRTERAVITNGVQDYLVKDETSGSLLLDSIRSALYANKRWQAQKAAAYTLAQTFRGADEKCKALRALGLRLIKLNRAEPALVCGKAIRAIADNYSSLEGSQMRSRADLLLELEHLANAAIASGRKELASQYRPLIAPPGNCSQGRREEFEAAMRLAMQQMHVAAPVSELANSKEDAADLRKILRQILDGLPIES
jgi:DNA-binding NarL/FixJ family response regulator